MTIQALIAKLQKERDRIDEHIKVLRTYTETPKTAKKISLEVKKRRMSAAARKAISRRMKAMWAEKRRAA
jgi:hypothetical protein